MTSAGRQGLFVTSAVEKVTVDKCAKWEKLMPEEHFTEVLTKVNAMTSVWFGLVFFIY